MTTKSFGKHVCNNASFEGVIDRCYNEGTSREQYTIMPPPDKIDLCAVLPVCNEEASLVAVVQELCAALTQIASLSRIALLIVDDYSQDNGVVLLKDWFRAQHAPGVSLTLVRLPRRHGHGLAVLKGCQLACQWSPRLTLVMDADGQDDPRFLAAMVVLADQHEIVFALRGKRSEPWAFRLCYAAFQALMWLGTGNSARANQFCIMRPQVLAYVAAVHYIDYLGAMLNASHFSRATLMADRRPRRGGVSKYNWRGHVNTALTIMSWQPRLLARLQQLTLLSLCVLGITAVITTDFFVTTLVLVVALFSHLWETKMQMILSRRADNQPRTYDEQVETLAADDDTSVHTA